MAAITLQDVSKSFGERKAVDSLSLRIDRGELVALVGPNGAGKTTTFRLISGYFDPDEGQVLIDDEPMAEARDRLQERIGYARESATLYDDMRVHAYLEYRAKLKGVARGQRSDAVRHAIEATQLTERAKGAISQLSKGLRQRVALADALVARPPILLLDEPTTSLDPEQKREFRSFLEKHATDRAVLISSHLLSELQNLATRIVILVDGAVQADGNLEALREQAELGPDAELDEVYKALVG